MNLFKHKWNDANKLAINVSTNELLINVSLYYFYVSCNKYLAFQLQKVGLQQANNQELIK